jgi:DNA (cytosine-5)-methyltransferase 1
MGAPHMRKRLFILAHAAGVRCGTGRTATVGAAEASAGEAPHATADRNGWWANEPRMDRMAYGLPGRVDRIRALGNAVVPQVAEHIGRLMMAGAR